MRFRDRQEAGEKLAAALKDLKGEDLVVLGIPRGGVIVAAEVASALSSPLDIVVTRKIEAPGEPEYALGAVTEDGSVILDRQAAESMGASQEYIDSQVSKKKDEVKERLARFRGDVPPVELKGKVALIIDDGIATGSSMGAAVMSVRRRSPEKIVVAVPVAPKGALDALAGDDVKLVALHSPTSFLAIGEFYDDFEPVEDDEVRRVLEKFRKDDGKSPGL